MDPELGWRPRPGYRFANSHINVQGLRGSRTYAETRSSDVLRVAAFGDSLVFGYEIDDGDCWPAIMEKCFRNSRPQLRSPRLWPRPSLPSLQGRGPTTRPRNCTDRLHAGGRRPLRGYFPFINERPLLRRDKPRFPLDGRGGLTLMLDPRRSQQELEGERSRNGNPSWNWDDTTRRTGAVSSENPLYDYSATVRLLCWLGDKIETHMLDRYRLYKGGQLNPLSQPFKVAVEVLDGSRPRSRPRARCRWWSSGPNRRRSSVHG